MGKCDVCGNEYHLSFDVITAGARHTFDSFECAIHKLAPICDHCGCKIVGHASKPTKHFIAAPTVRAWQALLKQRTMFRRRQ